MKPIVLILCPGNSCRSHMGEGFLRAAAGELVNVKSAGSIPTLASNPNCKCSNGLGGSGSATDTKTDTVFTTP